MAGEERVDPKASQRLPQVDGLRATAALGVFICHVVSGWHPEVGHGTDEAVALWLGPPSVALFFVVSGFVLYRPFVLARVAGGREVGLRRWSVRRAARIVPAYWFVLTVVALVAGLPRVLTDDWWIYYGFAQVYSEPWILGGLPQAWTLCVEVTFYLALPCFVRLFRAGARPRTELAVLALLGVASAASRTAWGDGGSWWLRATLVGTFAWFAVGMAFALVHVDPRLARARATLASIGSRGIWCWSAAAVLIGLRILRDPDLAGPNPWWSHPVDGLHFALIAALVAVPALFVAERSWTSRALLNPFMQWLGVVSFSFYLWHYSVIVLLAPSEKLNALPAAGAVYGAAAFLVTAALAALTFTLVERPFMRLAGSSAGSVSPVRPRWLPRPRTS